MSAPENHDGSAPTVPEGGPTVLPPLSDETVDRLESAVFARIAEQRTVGVQKRRSHRRAWVGMGSAAAVVVIAAAIAPAVGEIVSPMAGSGSAGSSALNEAAVPLMDGARSEPGVASGGQSAADSAESVAGGDALSVAGTDVPAGRDIVASASANVTVADIPDAADEVAAIAQQYEGYVEGLSVGTDGGVAPLVDDTSMVYPEQPRAGYGWVNVRIPAEQLQAAIDDLDEVGEVSTVSVNRSDVTDQAIDLRARVAATSASVARLSELMTQSGSVADLIAAEVALSDRQALLEGYEQQLAQLDSQVALSSLNVQLTTESEPVSADPAGFGDGLAAGWNGLVATLNGMVIAIGFLLPWIVVVGVAALIVRFLVRATRRRRASRLAASRHGGDTE